MMTNTEGSRLVGNHGDLLRMFLAIEEAKETIRRFEAGDITINEALRQLAMAAGGPAAT